ncbi:MAG: hypothetical protein H7A41_03105 [Chlamydiales bacterium]|nr:hypothetical protein [Chlamydiales bacterium]
MSEVPAIGSDTSVSTSAIISEDLTESQVNGLVDEAKTAIKDQNFDRAREIITHLSQVHHQAQAPKGWVDTFRGWLSGSKCPVTNNHLYDLFFGLCKESFTEGKKLIPIISKNFSIEVDGDHYKVSAGEFNRSFILPLKTDPEAKALLDHIHKLSHSRKFEELKGELPRLASHCAERKVAMTDFKNLLHCLVHSNSTFALRCFSIFEGLYEIRITDEKHLTIKDLKSNETFSFDCGVLILSDCERRLEEIAAKEKPMMRLMDYCFLAKHQVERTSEIMRKAEEQLDLLQSGMFERFFGKFTILSFYCNNHDLVNFERIAAMLERELNCVEETEKTHFFLAKLNVLRAEISLQKRDRSGYNDAIVRVAQEMKSVKEVKPFEMLQKDLERLKSMREETFPLDQMEWQAMKV